MTKSAADSDVLDRIARASNLAEECLTIMVSNFEAMDLLMDVAEGRSVFLGSNFQDLWHDVRMSRAHVANNPTGFARNYASLLMGAENRDYFL